MKLHIKYLSVFLFISIFSFGQDIIPDDVKSTITKRVDNWINQSIVVGVIDAEGTHFYNYGVRSLKTKALADENSIYEIGSISKTFTGILLANMVVKGDLKLDDNLQYLLPSGVTAPTRDGENIKLFQMSNHTSSLPRLPSNMAPANSNNPYVDYTEDLMFDFLNNHELTRDIGSQFEYSNYAVGLLGYLLALKNGESYESLMLNTIAKPLGLKNTSITFSPEMKKNLAFGHNNGMQAENWDLPTLAGAGAIRSNIKEMLVYLSANMGLLKSDLYPAMKLAHKNSRDEGEVPVIGLGWITRTSGPTDIIWHNGGTGGYRAFAGFLKDGTKGVVILTNSTAGVDDIGIHLLDPTSPMQDVKPSISIALRNVIDKEGIEAGKLAYKSIKKEQNDTYNFDEQELNILGYNYLNNNELEEAIAVFKLNVEAFPESFNVYDSLGEAFMKQGDNKNAIENYEKSVEINPGNTQGIEMLSKLGIKKEDIQSDFEISTETLENYVGKYELVPGFILTITSVDDQLMVQATGQTSLPVFPKSEREFYYKAVEAQLVFNANEDDEIISVTLYQNGQIIEGKKLDDD